MAVSPLLGSPKPQFLDSNGDPLNGGMVEFYAGGTSTPLDTYTGVDGLVANSNPIVLNSRGEPPAQIHSTENVAYKAVLKNANGTTLWTMDNIFSSNTISSSALSPFLSATLERNAAYTVVEADKGKLIRCIANTFNVTLLPAATAGEGFVITVTNDGGGVITIDPDAAELVNGVAMITLQPGEYAILTCTGTAWNGPRYIKGIPITDAGGTVDAMTADFTPNFTLTDGAIFQVKAVGAITSTTPNIAVDGQPARTIVKENDRALTLQNIVGANQTLLLQYDATLDKYILLNPARLEFIALSTPELLASALTEDSWTTVNSTTLSVAEAKYAIISHVCSYSQSFGGFTDIKWNGTGHLRQTGTGLSPGAVTRKVAADLQVEDIENGDTATIAMVGEGTVALDAAFDFDYYLTSAGFSAWASKELYLVGYYA